MFSRNTNISSFKSIVEILAFPIQWNSSVTLHKLFSYRMLTSIFSSNICHQPTFNSREKMITVLAVSLNVFWLVIQQGLRLEVGIKCLEKATNMEEFGISESNMKTFYSCKVQIYSVIINLLCQVSKN